MKIPKPLTGEDLVVAYIAYVDTLWVQDPDLVSREYAARLNCDVTDDATQRTATIADTDMVHPAAWTFRDQFIAHLCRTGQYSTSTAHDLGCPAPVAA